MEDKSIGRAVKELRCQRGRWIDYLCEHCSHRERLREQCWRVRSEIFEKRKAQACQYEWFADGYHRTEVGVIWTDGMSFRDGVGAVADLERREKEVSKREGKMQTGHLP